MISVSFIALVPAALYISFIEAGNPAGDLTGPGPPPCPSGQSQGEAVMTNISVHSAQQTSRFSNFVIGAFTAAMLIVAGLMPFTLFATH
jgi:hypothetical protein